jgi:hypothetical protein
MRNYTADVTMGVLADRLADAATDPGAILENRGHYLELFQDVLKVFEDDASLAKSSSMDSEPSWR